MQALDRIVFRTETVQVGAFECGVRDPRFPNSGPTERHLVVFPRTSVWIRHTGSRAFVADPHITTIYNRGQEYTREAVSVEGDRCDWFGVSPETAREIVSSHDARAADDEARPFRFERSRCPPELYLRQRVLFHQLERGSIDPLHAEESVLNIVASVIRAASDTDSRRASARVVTDAHRDLSERARADIALHSRAKTTVTDIARRLGVSPFHLCRVFRRVTGVTLHAYRTSLRQRMALESLAADSCSVSRVAADFGFATHSHLTSTLRRGLGLTPTALRALMHG
jgi:AraC-like DNA-binding protein